MRVLRSNFMSKVDIHGSVCSDIFHGCYLEQKMNKCTKSTTFLFAEHFPYSLVSLEGALGQCRMEV